MSIVSAYFVPHPPLAVPSVGMGREAAISKTLSAFDEVARAVLRLAPEVIVFITPHNVIYSDYFHISPGESASGDFSRFNAPHEKFEAAYDTELAGEIIKLCEAYNIHAGTLGEKDASIDHGVAVPMWYINRRYKNYKAVRICQSGFDPLEHYKLGKIIADASNQTGKRVVVVASGDLSHKMSAESSYGFVPEGPEFDEALTSAIAAGDYDKLLSISSDLRDRSAECGYNSAAMLAGCFDGLGVDSRLISYEGPFGVGYAVAEVKPGEPDSGRNFFEKAIQKMLDHALEKKKTEDAYRSLARQSLEYFVLNNAVLPFPENLPQELLTERAGVFVSINKNGNLRGCVGTTQPTCENIAWEIIQNAISACAYDDRFEPVAANELPLLTYKVDVLDAPEPVADIRELDVKTYGVIVSSGQSRGLLLPNLGGIDTVSQQVAIARQKGNIPEDAEITLQRFKVTRHE